ncbi:MAG: NUDIX hydrolase [Firmicutes bacterium]|nr:NUDIX hydrolase [Bacillota bacterium]
MDLTEKTVSTEVIYQGNIIDVRKETVQLPNGALSQREIVAHSGAAAVVALTEEGRLVLVRQYRKAVEKALWEIPAGKLDGPEDPLECAKRELAEETGYQAEKWTKLTSIYTTPGFSDEVIHIFLATGLTPDDSGGGGDEDEFVEVGIFSQEEIRAKIRSGELSDAKSLAGLCAFWVAEGEK